MTDETTTVLIVGGGLAGLTAAALLRWQGVPCVLVERHADLLIHPRARGVTSRTMEIYRQLGIEPEIKAASGLDAVQAKSVSVRASTLASEEFVSLDTGAAAALSVVSPSEWCAIDQDKLEIILRDKARSLGAELRFGVEATGFTQDADGVTVTIRTVGETDERTVRADHLIAADGNDSPIRGQLGIGVMGPGKFADVVSMMFEADLTEALRDRKIGVAYLEQPRQGTVLVRTAADRWSLAIGLAEDETMADYDARRCTEVITAAVGLPDVEPKIKLLTQIPGTDIKVLRFVIGAQVAQRLQVGRVFLVGDAAHIVPPTLGLGGSTAIQDSHNLAWKLAAVHHGQAGAGLLDTYAVERQPVALYTMGQLLAVFKARGGDGEPEGPSVDLGALVFGQKYRSDAMAGADADERPALGVAELGGKPGTRAPHVPVLISGRKASTVDLYGLGFALVAGPEATGWAEAGRALAADGRPVVVHQIGRDVEEDGVGVADAYGIGTDGAVLVRPDGFVAWRATHKSEKPRTELDAAFAEVFPIVCR